MKANPDINDSLRGEGEDAARARHDKAWAEKGNGRDHSAIDHTIAAYDEWLVLENHTPIYAMLGTIAANFMPGDAVWTGLIGPPSSAKTELLNSTSMIPQVVPAATLTVAGLLSGSPRKQYYKGAKGGLLRQIGDFGILVLKDFGSILSMHTESKAEVLAALREIYDGAWTRHLGTDGGRTLSWVGKLGLVFGCTAVIDAHYAVMGAMGERFLLNRLTPIKGGQFRQALKHKGTATAQMRKELAEAVAKLFANRKAEARPIEEHEIERIDKVISLVVRLRGSIQRDRTSRDIEFVFGEEGTARIGLTLERLLGGLDVLGVERALALDVVETVAMDSVPPIRRAAYEYLTPNGGCTTASTTTISTALRLPQGTVRRTLEDLTAYGLLRRDSQGQGKADLWTAQKV